MPHPCDCDRTPCSIPCTCSKLVVPGRKLRDATVVRDTVVLVDTPLKGPQICPPVEGLQVAEPTEVEELTQPTAEPNQLVSADFGCRTYYLELEYDPCRTIEIVWSVRGIIEDALTFLAPYPSVNALGTITLVIIPKHTVIDSNTRRPITTDTARITRYKGGCDSTRSSTVNTFCRALPEGIITIPLTISFSVTKNGSTVTSRAYVTGIDGFTGDYSFNRRGVTTLIAEQRGNSTYSVTFTSKEDNGRGKIWIATSRPVSEFTRIPDFGGG